RYFRRLVGLARAKLGHLPRAAADEDDVAQSAFHSFFRGVEHGRFARLDDRNDLWQVLGLITTRKVCDLIEYNRRQCRDIERTSSLNDDGAPEPFGSEPDPAMAAEIEDQFNRLLGMLPDEELRRIALSKLDGETNEQIAAALEYAPVTVERRLGMI